MAVAINQSALERDCQHLRERKLGPFRVRNGARRLIDFVGAEVRVGLDAHPALHRHLGRFSFRACPVRLTAIRAWQPHRPQEHDACAIDASENRHHRVFTGNIADDFRQHQERFSIHTQIDDGDREAVRLIRMDANEVLLVRLAHRNGVDDFLDADALHVIEADAQPLWIERIERGLFARRIVRQDELWFFHAICGHVISPIGLAVGRRALVRCSPIKRWISQKGMVSSISLTAFFFWGVTAFLCSTSAEMTRTRIVETIFSLYSTSPISISISLPIQSSDSAPKLLIKVLALVTLRLRIEPSLRYTSAFPNFLSSSMATIVALNGPPSSISATRRKLRPANCDMSI